MLPLSGRRRHAHVEAEQIRARHAAVRAVELLTGILEDDLHEIEARLAVVSSASASANAARARLAAADAATDDD